jgi:hypothetical protein
VVTATLQTGISLFDDHEKTKYLVWKDERVQNFKDDSSSPIGAKRTKTKVGEALYSIFSTSPICSHITNKFCFTRGIMIFSNIKLKPL